MSFSDDVQEYLLVRPPQSNKPGKHTGQNLQIQRLLVPASSSPATTPISPTAPPARKTRNRRSSRIVPILNLDTHAIRKTRIVETETLQTLCRFDREPKGVVGKWQVDLRRGMGGGWIFVGKYERYEWAKSRTPQFPTATSPGGSIKRAGRDASAAKGEAITWTLVQSTYSHTKMVNSQEGKRKRRKSTKSSLSEARTIRASMDDTSPERRLQARMTITPDMPPSLIIRPRIPRPEVVEGVVEGGKGGKGEWNEGSEEVNKEEVIDALVQGLWIVWREGVVDEINEGKRGSWVPQHQGQIKKKGRRARKFLDIILCRG